ncbi:MAG: hypothetical protein ABFD69_02360 [Candidatus Sumerlaeia bacterium]
MRDPIETVIQRELQSGENVLWSGSPRTGIRLRAADAFLIPFSLLWGGFAIFWEIMAIKSGPIFFVLWGIPFVLVGLYLVFGRFAVDAWARNATVYGVTNQRVIIASGFPRSGVRSLNLHNLGELAMTERRDLSGDITFGTSAHPMAFLLHGGWPGAGRYVPPAFEMIENVRKVHGIILQAQKQNQQR